MGRKRGGHETRGLVGQRVSSTGLDAGPKVVTGCIVGDVLKEPGSALMMWDPLDQRWSLLRLSSASFWLQDDLQKLGKVCSEIWAKGLQHRERRAWQVYIIISSNELPSTLWKLGPYSG